MIDYVERLEGRQLFAVGVNTYALPSLQTGPTSISLNTEPDAASSAISFWLMVVVK